MCLLQSLCKHHDEENIFKIESIKPYLNDLKVFLMSKHVQKFSNIIPFPTHITEKINKNCQLNDLKCQTF
jgi:hypothetical protein